MRAIFFRTLSHRLDLSATGHFANRFHALYQQVYHLVGPPGFGMRPQDLFEQWNPEPGFQIHDEYAKQREATEDIDVGIALRRARRRKFWLTGQRGPLG